MLLAPNDSSTERDAGAACMVPGVGVAARATPGEPGSGVDEAGAAPSTPAVSPESCTPERPTTMPGSAPNSRPSAPGAPAVAATGAAVAEAMSGGDDVSLSAGVG